MTMAWSTVPLHELVKAGSGKGRFLLYDEGEPTEHTPDEMWSHAPRY